MQGIVRNVSYRRKLNTIFVGINSISSHMSTMKFYCCALHFQTINKFGTSHACAWAFVHSTQEPQDTTLAPSTFQCNAATIGSNRLNAVLTVWLFLIGLRQRLVQPVASEVALSTKALRQLLYAHQGGSIINFFLKSTREQVQKLCTYANKKTLKYFCSR